MIGEISKVRKKNLLKGVEWRFGPNWPGQRCGARTRQGTPCQRPGTKRNGRCGLHGGKSTGSKTEAGRMRLVASKTTHGRTTKTERAKAKQRAMVGRQVRSELREIEQWALDQGHLSMDWRDQFK